MNSVYTLALNAENTYWTRQFLHVEDGAVSGLW